MVLRASDRPKALSRGFGTEPGSRDIALDFPVPLFCVLTGLLCGITDVYVVVGVIVLNLLLPLFIHRWFIAIVFFYSYGSYLF